MHIFSCIFYEAGNGVSIIRNKTWHQNHEICWKRFTLHSFIDTVGIGIHLMFLKLTSD